MIDQITHERRVSASVSTLAVASVAHPEEKSHSSPNVVVQANAEQNPSVSHRYQYVVAVTDDRQSQQSMPGIFANAQNILITGGTFIVGLCCSCVCDFGTYSLYRIFCLLILVETSL